MIQLGLSVRGGCDKASHMTCIYATNQLCNIKITALIMVKIDIKIAFNTICCDHLPEAFYHCTLVYALRQLA